LTQRRIFVVGATPPIVTYSIMAACVAVAVIGVALNPEWTRGRLGEIGVRFGLIGGGLALIDGRPALIGVDQGEWYRIVTGAVIHGGMIHLAFNMIALWQAGTFMESALGRGKFSLLFLVSLLGGSFGALLVNPDGLTVGASGGVFGLMGALFVAERKGLMGASGSSVGFFILINLVLTVVVPGISIGGHLGGLLAGTLVGWVMLEYRQRNLPSLLPVALGSALSVALFMGCLVAATFWTDPIFG
jgi:membrane associated rhomboid family serine protease